jgi:hypothetical protein
LSKSSPPNNFGCGAPVGQTLRTLHNLALLSSPIVGASKPTSEVCLRELISGKMVQPADSTRPAIRKIACNEPNNNLFLPLPNRLLGALKYTKRIQNP